jgi:hypothetical protein
MCVRPHPIWVDFLHTFTDYDTYVIIDDMTTTYTSLYENVKYIQIDDTTIAAAKFTDLNFMHFNKHITAWERAVFYFAKQNTGYDHVWLCEEDVFFHSEKTLRAIDVQYPTSDLLSNKGGENTTGERRSWLWPRFQMHVPAPWYAAMVCAIRMSRRMLDEICAYVEKYGALCYCEAFFPTVAKQAGLIYDTPTEMHTVVFKHNWVNTSPTNIYHPVKDVVQHNQLRNTSQ